MESSGGERSITPQGPGLSPGHLSHSSADANGRGATSRGSSSSVSSGQGGSTSMSGSGSGTDSRVPGNGSDAGSVPQVIGGTSTPGGDSSPVHGMSPTPRSLSLTSISSEGSVESHLVEHEDIVVLSALVRAFKESMGRLRKIFEQERDETCEKCEVVKVVVHEKLGEVLRILRNILEKYSPIQHNELLSAASKLISLVNEFHYDTDEADPVEFLEAIDHLALAFSTRVSDYLMGDIDNSTPLNCSSTASSQTKSCENLLCSDAESTAEVGISYSGMSREYDLHVCADVDEMLYRQEKGVELALHQAKVWSKYTKDILTFIEKKCQLILDFARNECKLVSVMKPIFKEEKYLPFQSLLCASMDDEMEAANSISSTFLLLQTSKFVEPLSRRRNEHEKSRKAMRETWHRQLKRLNEAVNCLKRAKLIYIQQNQELSKLGETLMKTMAPEYIEKLERKKEELAIKVREATVNYSVAVREANEQHSALLIVKRQVLQCTRELLLQADVTLKQAVVTYFQMHHSLLATLLPKLEGHLDAARVYEPGFQYLDFARKVVTLEDSSPGTTPFEFEGFSASETSLASALDEFQVVGLQAGSDTDSVMSSRSEKSVEASPTSSPHLGNRRVLSNNISSSEELERDTDGDTSFPPRQQVTSKAAETHAFRKLKTPSRCRECDSYVYFHGFECAECGLGCHKKCLETLAIQCGHKRLPRKLTTFGIDLQQHLQETNAQVPHLVTKCLKEIDARGINIKGIYRVSGLKSRVEKLCQAFENGAQLVDLTDQHPNVIANVLKLYLRQLPEPLLTFKLYSEFIGIAKGCAVNGSDSQTTASLLKDMVKRLPPHHLWCLGVLMLHLNKVAAHAELNNMPPSNLGIVFGPTLLRTSEGSASLSSLVDTVHQTKVIELLVLHAKEIFCSLETLLPKPLQQNPPLYYQQQQHHQLQQQQQQFHVLPQQVHQYSSAEGNTETPLMFNLQASLSEKALFSSITSLPSVSVSTGEGPMSSYKWDKGKDAHERNVTPSRQIPMEMSSNAITSFKVTSGGDEAFPNATSSSELQPNMKKRDLRDTDQHTGGKSGECNREGSSSSQSELPFATQRSQDVSGASIIKTSLKDYVGLEMAALQEARLSTLDATSHPKLKKSLSDNPPDKGTSTQNIIHGVPTSSTQNLSAMVEAPFSYSSSRKWEQQRQSQQSQQHQHMQLQQHQPILQQQHQLQSKKVQQVQQFYKCSQKREKPIHSPIPPPRSPSQPLPPIGSRQCKPQPPQVKPSQAQLQMETQTQMQQTIITIPITKSNSQVRQYHEPEDRAPYSSTTQVKGQREIVVKRSDKLSETSDHVKTTDVAEKQLHQQSKISEHLPRTPQRVRSEDLGIRKKPENTSKKYVSLDDQQYSALLHQYQEIPTFIPGSSSLSPTVMSPASPIIIPVSDSDILPIQSSSKVDVTSKLIASRNPKFSGSHAEFKSEITPTDSSFSTSEVVKSSEEVKSPGSEGSMRSKIKVSLVASPQAASPALTPSNRQMSPSDLSVENSSIHTSSAIEQKREESLCYIDTEDTTQELVNLPSPVPSSLVAQGCMDSKQWKLDQGKK